MTRPAPATCSAVAAFVIAVYANTLLNGFVVDDIPQIVGGEAAHEPLR